MDCEINLVTPFYLSTKHSDNIEFEGSVELIVSGMVVAGMRRFFKELFAVKEATWQRWERGSEAIGP